MCAQSKRKRTIDYNAEVAFERKPAAGFFETTEEEMRTKSLQQVRQKQQPERVRSG